MEKQLRIPAIRCIVILVLTFFLPVILGQDLVPVGGFCTQDRDCVTNLCTNFECKECTTDFDCDDDKCCEDGTCSELDIFSVRQGGDCELHCECFTRFCNDDTCEMCMENDDCKENKCCEGGRCSILDEGSAAPGDICIFNCECKSNLCTDFECAIPTPDYCILNFPSSIYHCHQELCREDPDCEENKCCEDGTCSTLDTSTVPEEGSCFYDCECINGSCVDNICVPPEDPAPSPLCPPGSDICNDPHVKGLRGQRMDVAGVDGGWYCLVKDLEIDLQVNVRFTAPLPIEFPHRQLITGIALLSKEHSLVIEVKTPYDASTNGCPGNISPCLVDGGLRITIDEEVVDHFLYPNRDTTVFDDITLSASNLPVECRQFGGENIWARMYEEMLHGQRQLRVESFEDWVLRFDTMAAHDWCTKYLAERGLDHVQSNHGVFKITTPTVGIRLNVGVNHQDEGEHDWDGRALPNLDFWQMDVGFEGLVVDHVEITGILGETARPVLDDQGKEVMSGDKALRGTVEDYRVSGPLGTNFALLQQKMQYQL